MKTPPDNNSALEALKEPFRDKYWEAFFNGARHDEMLDQAWPWLIEQINALTSVSSVRDGEALVDRLASDCAQHLLATQTDPGFQAAQTTPKEIIASYIRAALTRPPPATEGVIPADVDLEEIVGRAIVKEAWAIEGLPTKALTTGYRLLGRAAIDALAPYRQGGGGDG